MNKPTSKLTFQTGYAPTKNGDYFVMGISGKNPTIFTVENGHFGFWRNFGNDRKDAFYGFIQTWNECWYWAPLPTEIKLK